MIRSESVVHKGVELNENTAKCQQSAIERIRGFASLAQTTQEQAVFRECSGATSRKWFVVRLRLWYPPVMDFGGILNGTRVEISIGDLLARLKVAERGKSQTGNMARKKDFETFAHG